MKQKRDESNAALVARFESEARLALAKHGDRAGRYLDMAAAKGRQLEPAGRLVG
jgi:hypothetical protein